MSSNEIHVACYFGVGMFTQIRAPLCDHFNGACRRKSSMIAE